MKYSLGILLLFSIAIKSSSQNNQAPGSTSSNKFISQIEIVAGPGLSFLRGNPRDDNNDEFSRDVKLGFTYGIGLKTRSISSNLTVKTMVLFERKGSISRSNILYFDQNAQTYKQGKIKEEYVYDYYTIPVMMQYSFGKERAFHIGFGPYLSFLKRQITRETRYYETHTLKGISNNTSWNKEFDFGCTLNFSWLVPVSDKISLKAEILNTLGLLNTSANPFHDKAWARRTNNTNLLVGLILKR